MPSDPVTIEKARMFQQFFEQYACSMAGLAKGAMGQVFRPVDQSMRYAIKLVRIQDHRSLFAEPLDRGSRRTLGNLRAYQHEHAILSQISHPHVIRLLTEDERARFGLHESLISMPFMDTTLAALILQQARAEFGWYLQQIIRGLSYLHGQNIVHRDLKPSNILISLISGAKIADFGVAHILGTDEPQPCGTPLYAAPECHANDQKIDPSMDIYSLGVLMYEMYREQTIDSFVQNDSVFRHADSAGRGQYCVNSYHDNAMFKTAIQGLDPFSLVLMLANHCRMTRPEDRPSAAELASLLFAPRSREVFDWARDTTLAGHVPDSYGLCASPKATDLLNRMYKNRLAELGIKDENDEIKKQHAHYTGGSDGEVISTQSLDELEAKFIQLDSTCPLGEIEATLHSIKDIAVGRVPLKGIDVVTEPFKCLSVDNNVAVNDWLTRFENFVHNELPTLRGDEKIDRIMHVVLNPLDRLACRQNIGQSQHHVFKTYVSHLIRLLPDGVGVRLRLSRRWVPPYINRPAASVGSHISPEEIQQIQQDHAVYSNAWIELSRGTYGVIYQSLDSGLPIAVKTLVLSQPNTVLRKNLAAYHHELNLLRYHLDHPAIIKPLTTHEANLLRLNPAHLFMPLMQGSLDNYLDVPSHQSDFGCYVKQIVMGLEYLHARSLVHRDLKLANILIGEGKRAVITDFGSAVYGHHGVYPHVPLYAGTPFYVAPECLMFGDVLGPADPRWDIFSLGVMLYELYSRKLVIKRFETLRMPSDIINAQQQLHARPIESRFPPEKPTHLESLLYRIISLACGRSEVRPTASALNRLLAPLQNNQLFDDLEAIPGDLDVDVTTTDLIEHQRLADDNPSEWYFSRDAFRLIFSNTLDQVYSIIRDLSSRIDDASPVESSQLSVLSKQALQAVLDQSAHAAFERLDSSVAHELNSFLSKIERTVNTQRSADAGDDSSEFDELCTRACELKDSGGLSAAQYNLLSTYLMQQERRCKGHFDPPVVSSQRVRLFRRQESTIDEGSGRFLASPAMPD